METGMTSPRKYFVVVTHSATTQLELESVLSGGRYDNYDSAHASVYVEGLANFTSASELVARFSQHIERLDPPILKSDTRLVLAPPAPHVPLVQWPAQLAAPLAAAEHGVKPAAAHLQPQPCNETWKLGRDRKMLVKDDAKVVLTGIESALVRTLLQADERVVSKDDLIRSIGREPDQYRGLEMCLSRLQDKFRSASCGERLFRAVRNRGYCLIQPIVRES
ncbi:MAG: winged helix-turn-helix domain-containing protein [Pseudomonas sp.]|nr:winged helix-turn-helix domain-containing protein [Pseudomonas sp.]